MAQAVQGRARRCVRRPKKWADKNSEDRRKCGQSTNLGALRSKIRCESNSRRIEYEWGNSATDCKWRLGMRKFSTKMVPRILTHDKKRQLHISTDPRIPLQKWTIQPYLPDLAPWDFWLFPKLKSALKGRRFPDLSDIQRNVKTLFF